MHNPVTDTNTDQYMVKGHELAVSICSFSKVPEWGNPVLRSNFWRCYLPTTEGASIVSSSDIWPMRLNEAVIIPPECKVFGHSDTPFTLFYAHFNCSLRLKAAIPSTHSVDPGIQDALKKTSAKRDDPMFRLNMMQLVASALTSIPSDNINPAGSDRRTQQAYRIMKDHIGKKLTNAVLANQLNMSESSLIRMFRDTTGTSPAKEHLRIRLNHAASLLQQTDNSIEQIAEECGFWDRNHFTRTFTREWETAPGRYRRTITSL
jgi:AraC-like DNA-binding protein